MQLKLETKEMQGNQVVSVAGEINFNSVSEFKDCISKIAEGEGLAGVVVNMENVSYIDSSGIAAFIEAMQKIKAKGGAFKLCSLTESVKGVFSSTKLDRLLKIYSTLEEALAA